MQCSFQMSHISDYRNCPDNELPPMRYHKDWKKLIEVWSVINKNRTAWYAADFIKAVHDNNILKAYDAVVKAITQLNNK